MHSSLRRVLSAARTCKNAVWTCLKSVRRIPLLRSCFKHKKNARRDDEIKATVRVGDMTEADESQKATVTESSLGVQVGVQFQTELQEKIECVHRADFPTSADGDHNSTVKCEEKPKTVKKTRRSRRKAGKSHADTQKELPAESTVVGEQSLKAKDEVVDADESRCATKTPTDPTSRASPTPFVQNSSTSNKKEEPCASQNGKSADKTGERKKSVEDTSLPPKALIVAKNPQKTADVKSIKNLVKETPADSAPSSASNNVPQTCKSAVTEPVKKQHKNEEQLSEEPWKIVERTRKPRKSQPKDDVPCAKAENLSQQKTNKERKSFPSPIEPNNNNKNIPVKASNVSGDTASTKPSALVTQCSNTLGVKRDNDERFTAAIPSVFHMKYQKKITLHKTENPFIPTAVAREAAKNKTDAAVFKKKPLQYNTQEVKISVNSMLYKMKQLTESFAVLPINTVEDLENTVDLIFEKAIRVRKFTPIYASLCMAMQSMQVTSDDEKNPRLVFKSLILKRCQRQFQEDRNRRTEGVNKLKKINSCEDPVKKKELRFAYLENERRLFERAVTNCRFMGELFNLNMIKPSIMTYCMSALIGEISDESLECLCDLLNTAGRQLEACCDLKKIFDKLESISSHKNISSKTTSMIQDVMTLRKSKWSPCAETNCLKTIPEP